MTGPGVGQPARLAATGEYLFAHAGQLTRDWGQVVGQGCRAGCVHLVGNGQLAPHKIDIGPFQRGHFTPGATWQQGPRVGARASVAQLLHARPPAVHLRGLQASVCLVFVGRFSRMAVARPTSRLTSLRYSGRAAHHCARVVAAPGYQFQSRGLALLSQLVAHHESRKATFGVDWRQYPAIKPHFIDPGSPFGRQHQEKIDQLCHHPGNRSWTRPSGLRWGALARRDDAAGS